MAISEMYRECPVYETASFRLRLVRLEDAEDLLVCYSDPAAVSRMNADGCTSDFYYKTSEEMRDSIAFWLDCYKKSNFVRFSVVFKETDRSVGTVEMFGGEIGVLRIDLATGFESSDNIDELVTLAIARWIDDFEIGKLVVKVVNTPDRQPVYVKHGFVPSDFRNGKGYFEMLASGSIPQLF